MSPVLEAERSKRNAKKEERAKVQDQIDALLAKPTTEARALNDSEQRAFDELVAKANKLDEKIKKAKRTIKSLEAEEQRKAAAENAKPAESEQRDADKGGVVVRSEAMTYEEFRGGPARGGNSYYLDLALVAIGEKDASRSADAAAARARLAQHSKEVSTELRAMNATERRQFDAFVERSGGSYEQRVNPNTTFGTGGEFVPPLWLVSNFAPYKRPTRVFARRVNNMALPPGIDVINLPKITTGSLTGIQQAQGGVIPSQDIVTTTVAAPVRTIAGQEDISLQLLEQSPIAIDGVVFQDLTKDYDRQLDIQLLTGTGSPTNTATGGHLGVFSIASTTTQTLNSTSAYQVSCTSTVFHDTSTSATQYRSILNAVNGIETNYFDAPTAIHVHPRRANSWAYSAVDTQARPLYIPAKYGQYNTVGTNETGPTAQGVAGELYGLPVVKNANMPTTVNGFSGSAMTLTGGTQDPILILDESALWLWEGALRTRALPEILSGTLQLRYQVYAYSAFMPHRFPTAISVIAGAGVAAPGF